MVRTALVFIHVTSAIGVFAALAIDGAMLLQIRRSADSAQLRIALNAFRLMTVKPPLGASLIAMATAVAAGFLAGLTRFGRPVSHESMVSA